MRMNRFEGLVVRAPSVARLALVIGLASSQGANAAEPDKAGATLRLFANEAEARAHCPADKVIRIELPDGFFLHGDRGFGGASLDHVYLCRDEVARLFKRQGD